MQKPKKKEASLILKYEEIQSATQFTLDFSSNQAFIIFIASKCSNLEDIKSEILVHAFCCQEEKIDKFMMSDYFISQTQRMRKRCAKLKCQLKNQRLKWKVNEQSPIQRILIKHIIKAITFRKNRNLNIKFLRMELKNSQDPCLSKLFQFGLSYDWIAFLVYVILKNSMKNLSLLSQMLEIPENKLENFYELRKLAIVETQNQDTSRYRRLIFLWDSDEDRMKIKDEKQRLLVEQAIKKYGPKKLPKQQPKDTLNQIRYRKVQKTLYMQNPNQPEQNEQTQSENQNKTQIMENDWEKNNFELKEYDIYDSDDEINGTNEIFENAELSISCFSDFFFDLDKPYQSKIGFQNAEQSLLCFKSVPNLQTTVYSLNTDEQKQNQSKYREISFEKLITNSNSIESINSNKFINSFSEFEFNQNQTFTKQNSEIFNYEIRSFSEIKEVVQPQNDQELIQDFQQTKGKLLNFESLSPKFLSLSVEDATIIYLLYRLQGIEGIVQASAKLILKNSIEQLTYFLQNGILEYVQEFLPDLLEKIIQPSNYRVDVKSQRESYLLYLLDKFLTRQQFIVQMHKEENLTQCSRVICVQQFLQDLNKNHS